MNQQHLNQLLYTHIFAQADDRVAMVMGVGAPVRCIFLENFGHAFLNKNKRKIVVIASRIYSTRRTEKGKSDRLYYKLRFSLSEGNGHDQRSSDVFNARKLLRDVWWDDPSPCHITYGDLKKKIIEVTRDRFYTKSCVDSL